MKYVTVDELISIWTDAERELLRDHIEEARRNEITIRESTVRSLKLIKRMVDNWIGQLIEAQWDRKGEIQ